MTDSEARDPAVPPPTPLWIRLRAALVLALMGAGLLYTVGIGLANAGRIGV